MWISFSTRPRRYSSHGYSYVTTDIGDVAEGGWVSPFDPEAAYFRAETEKDLKKILEEIEAEEDWQRTEDLIDLQIRNAELKEIKEKRDRG